MKVLPCLIVLAQLFALSISGCHNEDKDNGTAYPILFIPEPLIDIGTVKRNDSLEISFKLINTGKVPLVIENVIPDCNCTGADWPRRPIAPSDSTTIKVGYNSTVLGYFMQKVTVYSNAIGPPEVLVFRGKVEI